MRTVLLALIPAALAGVSLQAQPSGPVTSGPAFVLTDAFPNLTWDDPTVIIPVPRSELQLVGERQGQIWTVPSTPSAAAKNLFLDLSGQTQGWSDSGILGVAFHPQFGQAGSPNRGYVYVYYSYTPGPLVGSAAAPPDYQTPIYDRLSRFTVPDGSTAADPNSELVLINQFDRDLWHNGGAMFFGADGFLYLSLGDEGGENDQYGQSQKINSGLFGGVIRIDVDKNPTLSHPIRRQPVSGAAPPAGWPSTYTQNYYIPNDNPWVDPSGGNLEEFWAIGLRSPHRMTRDPATGTVWLGDVGQDNYEEVDWIQKGGNYQWGYREGFHPGPKPMPSPLIGTDSPPIYEYPHQFGNGCVIGGYVYRGSRLPALAGLYIFGDYDSNRIWSMSYNGAGTPIVNFVAALPPRISSALGPISSFGIDANGEIYVCTLGPAAHIYTLALPPPPPVAPVITTQPVAQSVTAGASVSFTVAATGVPTPAYQWLENGQPITGATGATFALAAAQSGDAGSYSVTVTNAAGSAQSVAVPLTVSPAAAPSPPPPPLVPPTITAQPLSLTVQAGLTAIFSVQATGTPEPTCQWRFNGAPIPGADSFSYAVPNAQASNAGSYSVVVTNSSGSVASAAAALTVNSPPAAAAIVQAPANASITAGQTATFSVLASGTPAPTYAWEFNGIPIAGATGSSFTITQAQSVNAGTYQVVVSNASGSVISPAATLTVASTATTTGGASGSGSNSNSNSVAGPTPTTPPVQTVNPSTVPPRLLNVSVRALSGPGADNLTIGFVVGGSGSKTALLRAVGPGLAPFGVTGYLAHPDLTIYNASSSPIASQASWSGSSALSSAFTQTGAFPLVAGSADSAMLTTLPPGDYSAVVSGTDGGSGIVLLEAYDADGASSPASQLINLSVRGYSGAGAQVLTIGFVVGGQQAETLLIRGIGPALGTFGIAGALEDPLLTVFNNQQQIVAANDNWGGAAALTAAFGQTGAFALPPASKDAALIFTAAPGAYTVQLTGNGNASGIGLIELYELP